MWVGALVVTFMVLSFSGIIEDTYAQTTTANAGPDQAVASGETVTLDGSGSTHSTGTPTYSWTKITGPTITLSNNGAGVQPTFTAPTGPATITLRLEVNDGTSTSTDTVIITVRAPPMADAGLDQIVASGATVTLDGSGSVPAKSPVVSYDWITTSGNGIILSSTTAIQPTFTAPTGPDTVTFILRVTDQASIQFHDDTVTITVSAPTQNPNPTPTTNQPPTANAGRDKTFPPGSTVTLSGSGSDPDGNDADLKYEWEQTSITSETPTVNIDNRNSAQTTFTAPPDPTELEFTLTVFDGTDSATDVITITIAKPITRNIKEMSDTLVSAKITAPNEITMTYNEELSTFINSYLNFTITCLLYTSPSPRDS